VTRAEYANRRVPGAVVAVPRTAFVQSQSVSRAAVRVRSETIVNRPVEVAPLVAPTDRSVRGAAGQGGKPPARVFERPVVARTAPPAARAGFAAQQRHLNARPGRPLDDAARKALKPAAAAPAPVVSVVPQKQKKAPPTTRPPAAAPKPQPSQAQRAPKAERPARGEQRARPVAPPQRAAQPRVAPAPKAAPAAPAANQNERRRPDATPKPRPSKTQPAPKEAPRGQKAKPAAGESDEKKRDSEERKREEERLKQQRE